MIFSLVFLAMTIMTTMVAANPYTDINIVLTTNGHTSYLHTESVNGVIQGGSYSTPSLFQIDDNGNIFWPRYEDSPAYLNLGSNKLILTNTPQNFQIVDKVFYGFSLYTCSNDLLISSNSMPPRSDCVLTRMSYIIVNDALSTSTTTSSTSSSSSTSSTTASATTATSADGGTCRQVWVTISP